MREEKEIHPPRWATRFLEWYCKPELLEDLQGDLNEYFERNVKSKGAARAKLIYIADAVKFFRPYTIRKPKFLNLLIQWIMIGSYIKTSGRNIVRNKLFSFINIFGLAVSMSVGLLVITMVSDLFSYDDFHEKKERIYRVNTKILRSEHPSIDMATTSVRAGKNIIESFIGVEDVTLMRREFRKQILMDSLQFMVEKNRIWLYAFVIMPNHIHLLWRRQDDWVNKNTEQMFLKYTGQQIKFRILDSDPSELMNYKSTQSDREYHFWERRPYKATMYSRKVASQKVDYIHYNPVKAGLCDMPEDYKFSSYRYYELNLDDWGFITHYEEHL